MPAFDEDQPELETFAHAIATSKDMTLEQKVHWLEVSAEDLVRKLEAAERERDETLGLLHVEKEAGRIARDKAVYQHGRANDLERQMTAWRAVGAALGTTEPGNAELRVHDLIDRLSQWNQWEASEIVRREEEEQEAPRE